MKSILWFQAQSCRDPFGFTLNVGLARRIPSEASQDDSLKPLSRMSLEESLPDLTIKRV